MASTTLRDHTTPIPARISRTRALTVAGAVGAAVAVWAVAVPLLGLHLIIRFGNGSPQSVGIALVVGASLIGSLLSWGLLSLLETRTARAGAIWTVLAIAVLVVSLSLPLTAGVTVSTKIALALMHVAVGAVLIPMLPRGSATR
jgi:Family of unknown function (DUF6069)